MTKNKKKVWVWPPLTSSQFFPSERDLVIWTTDIDEQNAGGGGYSPIKVREVLVRKLQNLVLWACPKFISTHKMYQFNDNKLYNWHYKF